jgi:hypothetical protein
MEVINLLNFEVIKIKYYDVFKTILNEMSMGFVPVHQRTSLWHNCYSTVITSILCLGDDSAWIWTLL